MHNDFIIVLAAVVIISVTIQWAAWRIRIPALIFLILAGLTLGPFTGWINPSKDLGDVFKPFIALSVAIILFEGGLNLQLHELKKTGSPIIRLVSIGAALTLILGAASAHYIVGLDWPVALIFGAIIVVTGPTVIMPLLRQAKLRSQTASIVKWEGIVNDPTGALLAVLVFEYFIGIGQGNTTTQVLLNLLLALFASTILGLGLGTLFGTACKRSWIPEFLKAPVMLGTVILAYVLANEVLEEAGMLAVTILGVVIANQKIRSLEEIKRFKEYITLLLVSIVFILLTADIDLKILQRLDWSSAILLAAVIFILRPVTVYLSTIGAHIDWRDRLFVAWIAPRGIVAAATAGLFGPYLVEKGYAGAELLLPLIFALILLTVLLHGLSIRWLALKLGLSSSKQAGVVFVGASPWTVGLAKIFRDLGCPTIISDPSWHRLQQARMEGLETYHGEILSERAEETLELHEMTHVLAATSNEAYNALVCTTLSPEFGTDKVFRLVAGARQISEQKEVSMKKVQGKVLFESEISYHELMNRYYQGWNFQKTTLTEEFTYDKYSEISKDSLPIAKVDERGNIDFFPLLEGNEPGAGATIISYALIDDKS